MVIVGTHIDLVKKKKELFKQEIESYYCNAFYPNIKAISFVSYKAKSKYSVSKLCDKLYEIAASMETHLGVVIIIVIMIWSIGIIRWQGLHSETHQYENSR